MQALRYRAFAYCLSLLTLAVVLGPALTEGHHADHFESGIGEDFVHSEASHPSAAPHIDQEEHLGPADCAACLQHQRSSGLRTTSPTRYRAPDTSHALAPRLGEHVASYVGSTLPPRAPPLA